MRPVLGGSRSTSRVLVGRDGALSHLEALLDEAVTAGRLTTALVEGPAGMGKTRVVAELAERLRSRDVAVLVGHCVAQGGQTLPFAPLVDLLNDLVRREGATEVRRWAGPGAAELGRLVPALLGEHKAEPPGSGGSSRLFQALSTLLQNLAFRCPLLLVVEDLHWADTSTRELLALLARQQHGAILLLVTLRSDESPVPAGLAGYVAELVRRMDQRVVLAPLTRDEQARQMSDIIGVPPARALLDGVYARAEGNPFFAEELLAYTARGRDGLPETVRDLLLARLGSLEPATRQVLRAASVVGRDVPHRLLEAVVDVSAERLETALREAVEAHVLAPRGDTLEFRHALLQETVAASLLPGEAARTHHRVALALTERPALAGDGPGVAGRVARHWEAAGEHEQALVMSVAAGREASHALAFAEAVSHYQRALALHDRVVDATRFVDVPPSRLLWEAAEAANLAGFPALATDWVQRAIAAVDPDDAHLHGYLYARLGRCLWMSADGEGALAAYEKAVALVPADPPTRWRAAVLSGLSQILMLADRYEESAALALQAIEVAGLIPDGRSVEGHARCNLGVDLAYTGQLENGLAELRAARQIAEEVLDDVDDVARALVNLQSTLVSVGRMDEAVEVALECVQVGDALGLRRRKGVWSRCDAAQVLLMLGRFDQADRLLHEARELVPQGVDAFRTDLVEGQLRLRQGDLQAAVRLVEHGRAASARLVDPQLLGPLYAALVETAIWQGDSARATELVVEGLDRVDAAALAFYQLPFLGAAVRAATGSARNADVEGLLDRAALALRRSPAPQPHAAAELAAARAETTGSAEAWVALATDWETLGEEYRASYARLRAAETLLAGGGRDLAAPQLELAVSTAARIGARHLVHLAEDLGRRSRLSVGAAPTDNPYRLTQREREVLDRVAEGLTDRAIGERLFISHRTVERHVSNLLAKLGAERRSELVATAHREGLVLGRPTP